MVLIMLTVVAPVARASGSWQQAEASPDPTRRRLSTHPEWFSATDFIV
jgi:hypothetical protein